MLSTLVGRDGPEVACGRRASGARVADATIRARLCSVPEPSRRSATCQRRVIQTFDAVQWMERALLNGSRFDDAECAPPLVTLEELQPLFRTAEANPEWDTSTALESSPPNTSMRGVEVKHVRDEQTRDPAERFCLRGSRSHKLAIA